MATDLLRVCELGDMKALFFLDTSTRLVEMMLIPSGMETPEWSLKDQRIDSMIQVKLLGDNYPGAYSGGISLRQSESVYSLEFSDIKEIDRDNRKTIIVTFTDKRGYKAKNYLVWKHGSKTIESYVEYRNKSPRPVTLEMLSSFSLGGLSPFIEGGGHESLKVHRIRSVWSMEGRLESNWIEDLQLEPSWAKWGARSERFGQVGSMPTNKFFPYLVIEDTKNNIFWGARLAHNASWQMEVYRMDEGLAISGDLADREFGHWMKTIKPGEVFTSPRAILSVCQGTSLDDFSQRLASSQIDKVNEGPLKEQDLPIVFNEYCSTWGNPSHENIIKILEAIKDKGLGYFVIDCGWFKEGDKPWDIMMGDYEISKELFPEGLKKTVEAIKDAGLAPGIWFEIDNVGGGSRAYYLVDHLLKRDGITLTTATRRFWDLNDPWVWDYLHEKVIGMIKEYGFSYLKIDCNDTMGIGCDDPDSLGEGLRKNALSSYKFIEMIKEEVPDIVVENCASGGSKLEPLMIGATSMSSFSDAHECEEIPVIAANLHRVMLPRQSQIWAVIRRNDSLKRIVYTMASTFLGRMCLSGDVTDLSKDQWDVIDKGIGLYKRIAPIIKDGHTYWFGPKIKSYRVLEGWQGILRVGQDGRRAYLVIHVFNGHLPDELIIDLPGSSKWEIEEVYDVTGARVFIDKTRLVCMPKENMSAISLVLKR